MAGKWNDRIHSGWKRAQAHLTSNTVGMTHSARIGRNLCIEDVFHDPWQQQLHTGKVHVIDSDLACTEAPESALLSAVICLNDSNSPG